MGIVIILLVFTLIVRMNGVSGVIVDDDSNKTIMAGLSVAVVVIIILLSADFAIDVNILFLVRVLMVILYQLFCRCLS
jgi:hypothetical protein